ncbi:hypothetical protein, partial [Salmonella enterica]
MIVDDRYVLVGSAN